MKKALYYVNIVVLLLQLAVVESVDGEWNWQEFEDYEVLDLSAQNFTNYRKERAAYKDSDYDYEDYTNYINNSTNKDDEKNPHRIVGGKTVHITAVPYQCAIFVGRYFTCGCSILTHRWILTAAHCVFATTDPYWIRAGTANVKQGGQIREVVTIVKHRRFTDRYLNRDIAMMRVRQPFIFSAKLRPVRLPKPGTGRPKQLVVSGWGLMRNDATNIPRRLQATAINVLSWNRCRQSYHRYGVTITRYMFCAGAKGRDSCSGDSGGSITYKGIVYGIVSFGFDCADPEFPGIYTNVLLLVPWIKKVIVKYANK